MLESQTPTTLLYDRCIFIAIIPESYFVMPPILQTVVPHTGHFPFAIFVPFEVVDSTGFFISRCSLHFTQYPFVDIFSSFAETDVFFWDYKAY